MRLCNTSFCTPPTDTGHFIIMSLWHDFKHVRKMKGEGGREGGRSADSDCINITVVVLLLREGR